MKKRDWDKEVRDFLVSGKTQAEFARERGLASSDLSVRLRQAREGFVPVGEGKRIELEIAGVAVRIQPKDLPVVMRSLIAG